MLGRLASEWFERPSGEEISLQDWLREEFDPDEDLAAAALQGLRDVVDRDDMPGPDEILNLHSQSRRYWLSLPFLAALHDRHQEAPSLLEKLTERQQRQALALHYCLPAWGHGRDWHHRLIQQRPEVAASVLLPFARAEIRSGRGHVAGLQELAHDPNHAKLAALVVLPLLRGFPVRGSVKQLPDLSRLLWAALQHGAREELRALVAKKLEASSMTDAVRATWLGAGLVADPQTHAGPLEEFVDGIELRAERLADFLWFGFIQGPKETAFKSTGGAHPTVRKSGHLQERPRRLSRPVPGAPGRLDRTPRVLPGTRSRRSAPAACNRRIPRGMEAGIATRH